PGDTDLGVDPEMGIFTSAAKPDLREAVVNETGDYGRFWRALVDALQGTGPNPVPVSEALHVMEVLQAGLESAAKGSTVRL
ncbi:MAG TPA: Gfo/Idh/MocA family oxidoreductase, partial [Sphingomicrobium sp.]